MFVINSEISYWKSCDTLNLNSKDENHHSWSFLHDNRGGCNRRCRDGTAAGWATASLAIRFLTTGAHTTAHCPSLRLMRTHAYICGHMHTQRHTQGPYVPTRVHKRTLREGRNTSSRNLCCGTCSPSTIPAAPQVKLPHSNTHTYTSTTTTASLYANIWINNLSHVVTLIWTKHAFGFKRIARAAWASLKQLSSTHFTTVCAN